MSAQYTQLPTYSDDVKQAEPSPITININESGETLVVGESCAQRRSCFFGRMRARCAARYAAKYGPPCENPGCQDHMRRKRRFRRFFLVLLGLFAIHSVFHVSISGLIL